MRQASLAGWLSSLFRHPQVFRERPILIDPLCGLRKPAVLRDLMQYLQRELLAGFRPDRLAGLKAGSSFRARHGHELRFAGDEMHFDTVFIRPPSRFMTKLSNSKIALQFSI